MSDLSVGQWVGGIVGAIVGAYAYGPTGAVQGFALGAGIGGFVDPPPGPNLRGPTLDDKTFQSAAYGVSVSRLYGQIATMGTIIYLENNQYSSTESTQESGGKGGGGGGTYTTTTYFATFAVALGEAMPGSRVLRIWAGGKLILSTTPPGLASLGIVHDMNLSYIYYDGTQTEPDSRMEAVLGVGNCPSYEGTAYIVFHGFELTEYGNGLAGCPMKVEIADGVISDHDLSDFELQGTLNYFTPAYFDTGSVRCAIALDERGRTHYSNVAVSASNKKLYYSAISGSGTAAEAQQRLYNGYPVYSDGLIRYANHYNYYVDGELNDGVYTNAGDLRNLFFGFPFASSAQYANIEKLFSVGEKVYTLFNTGPIVPSGIPVSTAFLGALGSDSVFIAFERADIGTIAIFDDRLFRLTKPVSGQLYFKQYSILTGAEIFSYPISIPVSTSAPDNAHSAVIYDGKFITAYTSVNTLQLISIDILTFEVSTKAFAVDTTNTVQDGFNVSVHNGVIAVSVRTYYAVSDQGGLRVFITAVPANPANLGLNAEKRVSDICENEFKLAGFESDFYDLSGIAEKKTIGYRVSGPSSARGALSPLMAAYLFDFVEIGYKLHAVQRGGSAVYALSPDDFCLQNDGTCIKSDDNTGATMPTRMSVNYIDWMREYDPNTQYADYPSSANNMVSKDIPVVLNPSEAIGLAGVFISVAWEEKKKFNFLLTQKYLQLRVSNIIKIPFNDGMIDVRIDSISCSAEQVLTIDASRTSAYAYEFNGDGASGLSPPATVIVAMPDPNPVVLDIPMINERQDFYGIVSAVYQRPPFKRSVLMLSADGGRSYNEIGRFSGPGVIGQCIGDMLAAHDGLVSQYNGELRVDSILAGEFYSVTRDEMMTGKNYVAYGAPGRWEIMCYVTATPINNGTGVLLSNFIRGMFGTEQYTGTHSVIDYVVLLDYERNIFAPLPLQSVGLSWPIIAVNVGSNVEQGVLADPSPYQAVNLKPLAVVHPLLVLSGNNWSIDFDPRTRYQSSKWTTGAGENTDTISYEIDIIKSGTAVRTLSSATKPIIYSSAEQIADFGSNQTTLTVDIYQISQRVGRGYKLRATK